MAFKTAEEIRKKIAEKMVESITSGVIPWRQPWANSPNIGSPANFSTNRRYTGINTIILWLFGDICQGFKSRYWGTSYSWTRELGVHVRKGQHATGVVLFKRIDKKKNGVVETTADGKKKTIPIMREFPVFNVDQLQAPEVSSLLDGRGKFSFVKALLGQVDKKERKDVTTVAELQKIAKRFVKGKPNKDATREELAKFIQAGITASLNHYKVGHIILNNDPDYAPIEELYEATGAVVSEESGLAARYHKTKMGDSIDMPPKRSFETIADYYQTKSHEMIHWVVNGGRIEFKNERKDEEAYAFNELVAEIGACFLNTEMGVPLAEKMLAKSQAYVGIWLKRIGNDPKFIFDAASIASKACDFLLAKVGRANPAYEEKEDDKDSEDEVIQKQAA